MKRYITEVSKYRQFHRK